MHLRAISQEVLNNSIRNIYEKNKFIKIIANILRASELMRQFSFQMIQKKFAEFQLGIEAGVERFKQCEKTASQLLDNNSPYAQQIIERQEHIRWDRNIAMA